jgi:hypothetical protein
MAGQVAEQIFAAVRLGRREHRGDAELFPSAAAPSQADDFGNQLYVPHGYTSGTSLMDSATYDTTTFSVLGATPGTYEWTWGSGANQNFTLQIGAVPAPLIGRGPPVLLAVGGLLFGAKLLERGKRHRRRAGSEQARGRFGDEERIGGVRRAVEHHGEWHHARRQALLARASLWAAVKSNLHRSGSAQG